MPILSAEYSEFATLFERQNSLVRGIIQTEEIAVSLASRTLDVMDTIRRRQLADILEVRGLALCQSVHVREPNPEHNLGLFPKNKTKLYYETIYMGDLMGEEFPEENWSQGYRLERLCDDHFSREKIGDWSNGLRENFGTEVQEIEGRLFTKIRNLDVTHLRGEIDSYYDEKIYAYFGLPELPRIASHRDLDNPSED